LICSLHNYCDKCSDFIIKNNKAACYDKITGCMNCSGLFGLEETVAINKISQIFYKNAILPSENMQIVENKANIIPNQYESASSDMVIEFEELKIEEQKIENSLNTDNFIVKVSLNNAKEAEVILNDLNRNRVEVREQCFGCERKINSTVYGKCGHGICELCIFFYTYLPVFKEFINIKELPNSRLVYYCKCREEIEVYYPIMKLLKYVADVVEASKAETIGAIYREFIYIHQNRDMFIKYIDYLEGLPCVFQICPDCSRPCFLVNSKIICPWESSHNNSS
jgi:hypothetical protein